MIDVSFKGFGINTDHAPDVTVDRPNGMTDERPYAYGCHLVTCFQTPFVYLTSNGMEQGVPGDCVVHDPVSPQRHGPIPGAREGFRNDWIHIYGEGVPKLIDLYGIPLNTIIPTGRTDLITSFIQSIAREWYSGQLFSENAIAGHINAMLLRIGRCYGISSSPDALTPAERALLARFVEVRLQVRGQFKRNWTVEDMAEMACLSTSRFSVLYRKFFGTSPVDDLLDKRMEHATYLLSVTDSSVGEVAGACGFTSQHYFSRLFRKRMGCTPSTYAKWERSEKGEAVFADLSG